MRNKDAQTIVQYYHAIPEMQKLLRQEGRDIQDEYYGLPGIQMDGMPHGTAPGKPVEAAAIAIMESGVDVRLREIENRLQELDADRRTIQDAIDQINGRYKNILNLRYAYRYSWGKISVQMGVPDSTARHWNDKALYRLGKVLDDAPEITGILNRASRARV